MIPLVRFLLFDNSVSTTSLMDTAWAKPYAIMQQNQSKTHAFKKFKIFFLDTAQRSVQAQFCQSHFQALFNPSQVLRMRPKCYTGIL